VTAGSPPVRAAALIRADIRAAAQDRALGEFPAGISFSVSASTAATAPGVTVTVYGAPGEWAFTGTGTGAGRPLSPECDALRRKLTEIAGRHWQPAVPGGFTDVQVLGPYAVSDDLEELTGPPAARGDIPGHPKRRD
jgi:hypothetical protein